MPTGATSIAHTVDINQSNIIELTPFDTTKVGRWCYAIGNSGLIWVEGTSDPHRPYQSIRSRWNRLTGRLVYFSMSS